MRAVQIILLLSLLLGVACSGDKKPPTPAAATGQETPPPDASSYDVAQKFLSAWQEARFGDMYTLLSPAAKQAIARDRFVARYEGIADEATIVRVQAEAQRPADPGAEQIPFSVTITTGLWGEIKDTNTVQLSHTPEGWRVDWSPSLIFRQLTGANLVRAFIDSPKRGAILDRNGKPLAVTGTVPTVGTAKNLINVKQLVPDRDGFINWLAQKIGLPADDIKKKVDDPKMQTDVFIPLKTLPYGTPDTLVNELENTAGVLIQQTPRRIYPYGAAAAHVTGYVAPITAEQLDKLKVEGYTQGDLVGSAGLEASFERELAGERGARLTIISPEGTVVETLRERPGRPPRDVVTSIDITAQLAADQALGQRTGSIVLLDPRDDGVVAMVSHPSFDPNAFVTGLPAADGARLLNDAQRPLLNRAVNATYPPGSTFKVITGAAGLERGGYTASSRFPCTPTWYGLGPSNPKNNWTKADEGALTIAEGLMRSCNPVFYEIALKLDNIDPNILPSFAAGFGLGRPTGINGLEESKGVDPNPEWKKQQLNDAWYSGDSVNMGIGQGFLLVTPLQIANMYSAIAQGGSLRTPMLVRELREAGKPQRVQSYEVKEIGRLPISDGTLAVIRDGTRRVAQDPRGTAYSVFQGSSIDPAGKSGTAEDQGVQEHALFAAYAPRTAAKGVAVVVLDEGKSGSLEAGPMTRQVLEAWLRVAG